MSLRTFVALELKDGTLKKRVAQLQEALIASGAQLKPVESQNLHITLKFLGDIPESSVAAIKGSLGEIRLAKFSSHFKGVGVFPSATRINVVWLGMQEGEDKVRDLASQVNRQLAQYGQEGGFRAHLTIARVKGGRNIQQLASQVAKMATEEGGEVSFSEFQLKKSVLTPSGPVYSDLAVFSLV